jgi:hypothetical protein
MSAAERGGAKAFRPDDAALFDQRQRRASNAMHLQQFRDPPAECGERRLPMFAGIESPTEHRSGKPSKDRATGNRHRQNCPRVSSATRYDHAPAPV